MPIFKQRIALDIARNVRAFLNLEAGITRVGAPGPARRHPAPARDAGISPENVVWIFGTARTGSTWLSGIMGAIPGHTVWFEPFLGTMLAEVHYGFPLRDHLESVHHVVGTRKELWAGPMRRFVLETAALRFPETLEGGRLVVKEPNGSAGAPLLSELFPESGLVFLVRDPRDVVASALEMLQEGSWYRESVLAQSEGSPDPVFGASADEMVEERALVYLQEVSRSAAAYDAHAGPKTLIRYEDLRADTLGTLLRAYHELAIPVSEGKLARAVERHSWENAPEEAKGKGKFFRRATPGGWREDLSAKQVETVERITAPLLKEFYS